MTLALEEPEREAPTREWVGVWESVTVPLLEPKLDTVADDVTKEVRVPAALPLAQEDGGDVGSLLVDMDPVGEGVLVAPAGNDALGGVLVDTLCETPAEIEDPPLAVPLATAELLPAPKPPAADALV